jgi:hypothetical protein
MVKDLLAIIKPYIEEDSYNKICHEGTSIRLKMAKEHAVLDANFNTYKAEMYCIEGEAYQRLIDDIDKKTNLYVKHLIYAEIVADRRMVLCNCDIIPFITEVKVSEDVGKPPYVLTVKQTEGEKDAKLKAVWDSILADCNTDKILLVPNAYDITSLSNVTFDFSKALELLKLGYKVQRKAWNFYIYLIETSEEKCILSSEEGYLWRYKNASDLLANDYTIVVE